MKLFGIYLKKQTYRHIKMAIRFVFILHPAIILSGNTEAYTDDGIYTSKDDYFQPLYRQQT